MEGIQKMTESNGKYEVELSFVECPTEDERRDREDRIIAILVDNAIKSERTKIKKQLIKEKSLTKQ